jgi:UDP-N-acetyl-D-glucosamine dehydrogenase
LTLTAQTAVDRTHPVTPLDTPAVPPAAHQPPGEFGPPEDRDSCGGSAVTSVAVVGLGYVGLPTALALHDAGASVTGLDVSRKRLAAIKRRDVDLLPRDRERLAATLGGTRLALTADPAALRGADAVIVCVPTPVDRHRTPDLGPLRSACDMVVRHARSGQLIILTSTTYVGSTCELLARPLAERELVAGRDVHVAFSPERVDPGNPDFPVEDVPRVVGGMTPECTRRAAGLLGRITPRVHAVGSAEAAELTKLFENTFRAVNIALANELADISRTLGLDVTEVIGAASTKPYGFMPFHPGPGVGGHCIPCDPHYLLWQLRGRRATAPLIDQAMQQVAARPLRVVDRAGEVLAAAGRRLAGARVVVAGVTYKPGVADVRESPALVILEELVDRGAEVAYYDPLVASVRLADGRMLRSLERPPEDTADLVIVHTLQPRDDHGWLALQPRLLDASYRLDAVAHRAVV